MKLARALAAAVMVSAWLCAHAIFTINVNMSFQREKNAASGAQKFLPIRIPSVFQLSWFQNLVRHVFATEKLVFPHDSCGQSCLLYLSWIVSVLTLAEWIAFAAFLLRAVWSKLICPVFSTLGYILLAAGVYGCVRTCAFMLAPHLPEDAAVSVVRALCAVDKGLWVLWDSLGGAASVLLWTLDGLLSSLVWPSLEDIMATVVQPSHRQLLSELLAKVKEVAHTLPETVPHPEF
ncbi:hypothetical protein, conserved [Eimeria necatrix]|uniref:Transmembrane protein n=1 Tax=Eimeria necatrix TaxID=51315 RepID=U6MF32_9EIME|nr:hypothetical protein, conserved [Eimeria necatrix]CDJ62862.1 hypothetical protein, conserved [Eimeria necatrix]